jgi:hypothetical protein
LLGAAVDIEHFEILVKAMLRWSDEPKAPKKTVGRTTAAAGRHDELDELDDEEDEALVDDDDDDEDAPAQALPGGPAGAEPADADPDEAEASEQLD